MDCLSREVPIFCRQGLRRRHVQMKLHGSLFPLPQRLAPDSGRTRPSLPLFSRRVSTETDLQSHTPIAAANSGDVRTSPTFPMHKLLQAFHLTEGDVQAIHDALASLKLSFRCCHIPLSILQIRTEGRACRTGSILLCARRWTVCLL